MSTAAPPEAQTGEEASPSLGCGLSPWPQRGTLNSQFAGDLPGISLFLVAFLLWVLCSPSVHRTEDSSLSEPRYHPKAFTLTCSADSYHTNPNSVDESLRRVSSEESLSSAA